MRSFALFSMVLLAVMVCEYIASPLAPSGTGLEKVGVKSFNRRDLQMQRLAQNVGARMERFAALPEDQRQFMSKQILQALSEIIQRDDCFSDYQGWVDFGRRSTD